MESPRQAFLAGERPDDVLIYLSEDGVSNLDALSEYGERVSNGVVLVLDGERGRSAFERAVGVGPMSFAGTAMDIEGDIASDCTNGECPSKHPDEPDADHALRFLFAFVEAQKEDVGGIYADGDVVHAYAACTCGTAYSDRWVARDDCSE